MPTSGYMNSRVIGYDLSVVETQFGDDSKLVKSGEMWCNVRYQNGSQVLRQGDLMMARSIVITCRRHDWLNERSHLKYDDNMYRITSYNENKRTNSVTIVAEKYE